MPLLLLAVVVVTFPVSVKLTPLPGLRVMAPNANESPATVVPTPEKVPAVSDNPLTVCVPVPEGAAYANVPPAPTKAELALRLPVSERVPPLTVVLPV